MGAGLIGLIGLIGLTGLIGLSWPGAIAAAPAPTLPPQDLSYRIEAWLDPPTRGLRGHVRLRWKNSSTETIRRVPLHLYLNAFSHQRTTWMREAPPRRVDLQTLLAQHEDPWGFSEPRAISQISEGKKLRAGWWPIQPDDGNRLDRSLFQVNLPRPILLQQTLELEIDFFARLPIPIARTGGDQDYFLVAQWFPKLGAFEQVGVRGAKRARWAARQFHGPTEFYATFADYDVTVHVPEAFHVAATGRSRPARVKAKKGRAVYRFVQRAVHDFAFVASTSLVEHRERYRPKSFPTKRGPNAREVTIRYLLPRGTEHQLPRWQRATRGALDLFSSKVGPYPYPTLTVIFPPWRMRRTAGMEYPTLITSLPGDRLWDGLLSTWRQPEAVLVHEFGHQYFYGLLASNEQQDAFLDEGFNTYWQVRAMQAIYAGDPGAANGRLLGRRLGAADLLLWSLEQKAPLIVEPMIRRPAALFRDGAGGAQIYLRAVATLMTAAARFGQDQVDAIFAAYYRRFAFKHPGVEDFLAVVRDEGGEAMVAFLREAFSQPRLPDYRLRRATCEHWRAPLGLVRGRDGRQVTITAADRARQATVGLPDGADEKDGRIGVEIIDPGWATFSERREGLVRRVRRSPRASKNGAKTDGYFESDVIVDGPAWRHLPLEIEFLFSDGARLRERWDGRAAWRRFRFVRRARLTRVEIDPDHQLLLDVSPQNNGRTLAADQAFSWDWGLWLASLAQWTISTAGGWL